MFETNDMIERVARKLHRNNWVNAGEDSWAKKEWLDLLFSQQEIYRRIAEAAIQEMREPTDKMIVAGNEYDCAPLAADVWRAMIDAAIRS